MDKKATFKKYKNKAAHILEDNERINGLLQNTKNKLKSIVENNEKLQDLTGKVTTFYRMLRAKLNGDYDQFPWRTVFIDSGGYVVFCHPI